MVSPEPLPSRRDARSGETDDAGGFASPESARAAEEPVPRAVLPAGWYPDPHRRWNARYWDGQLWTGRVAQTGGDATPMVFGNDPVAPPQVVNAVADDTTRSMRYEATVAGELARLRAEVDTWRGIAVERASALSRALSALESLAEGREVSIDPRARIESVDPSAAESALLTIPDPVRIAAQCELFALNSKPRRWWRRIIDTPIR